MPRYRVVCGPTVFVFVVVSWCATRTDVQCRGGAAGTPSGVWCCWRRRRGRFGSTWPPKTDTSGGWRRPMAVSGRSLDSFWETIYSKLCSFIISSKQFFASVPTRTLCRFSPWILIIRPTSCNVNHKHYFLETVKNSILFLLLCAVFFYFFHDTNVIWTRVSTIYSKLRFFYYCQHKFQKPNLILDIKCSVFGL